MMVRLSILNGNKVKLTDSINEDIWLICDEETFYDKDQLTRIFQTSKFHYSREKAYQVATYLQERYMVKG